MLLNNGTGGKIDRKYFSSTASTLENSLEGWIINYQHSEKYSGNRINLGSSLWPGDALLIEPNPGNP